MPEAECALVKMPLCHDRDICNLKGDIDVFVKRILAAKPNSSKAIWLVQGGPGSSSKNLEPAMVQLYDKLESNVDIYTLDHRGTGRSTFLNCVAAQATNVASDFKDDIALDEIPYCSLDVNTVYENNLSAFSTTSAAFDIATFVNQEQSSKEVYVYGVSYGSSVVERLMHLNASITGYILDGISTTSGASIAERSTFSKWDSNMHAVGTAFLNACDIDENCGGAFNATKALLQLLDRMDSKRIYDRILRRVNADDTSLLPSSRLKYLLGELLQDPEYRQFIPPIIYRLFRLDKNDELILVALIEDLVQLLEEYDSSNDQYFSILLYRIIVFSEMWEYPSPTFAELTNRFNNAIISNGLMFREHAAYCMFSKEKSSSCNRAIKKQTRDYPKLVYPLDKYFNVPARLPNTASVLIMSSRMDPQTIHKYAIILYNTIKAKNKALIEFEYATHGLIYSTTYPASEYTCAVDIIASFVDVAGDTKKLNRECTSRMQKINFDVNDSLLSMMRTDDPYDGDFLKE